MRSDCTAALDASIASAAARHLQARGLLTTGQLIELLLHDGEILTATSDPGRRKQVERALSSPGWRRARIERASGRFPPFGAMGRPARYAWRVKQPPLRRIVAWVRRAELAWRRIDL